MPKPPRSIAYRTRRRWTVADARAALAALAASGLSARAFAIREGLDPQRLRRWAHDLDTVAEPEPTVALPPKFVEVRPRVAEPVEVVLRSGRVLRVAESIDTAALVRLVEALERADPC
jgi:hypothetical protein